MRVRLLLVLLARAAAEWVEISQSHYRKPLKTFHVTHTTLQAPISKAPEIAALPRNHSLNNGWVKGHVYRSDHGDDRPLSTKNESQKINPFLTRPINSKKPNSMEIIKPTPKPNENKLIDDHVLKPYRDKHASNPAPNQRPVQKTPNRVVFLDRDPAHNSLTHSSEESNRHKTKGQVQSVKKPEKTSEESKANTRRADILITSEEYGSVAATSEEQNQLKIKGNIKPVKKPEETAYEESAEINRSADILAASEEYGGAAASIVERNRHKNTKGKVESVEKPEDIRPPKKNHQRHHPKQDPKGTEKKITIVNVNPTNDSDEQYADSIGNVKLVFQKPASNVKLVSNHSNKQGKKPNRIYLNTLRSNTSADERDRISSSVKPKSDDSFYSSTEPQHSEIEETFTKRIKQPGKNSKTQQGYSTEHPVTQDSSEMPTRVNLPIAPTNDKPIKHFKDDFKRLDVSTLNYLKDPGFVTKYETFEIENDEEKYADVTVESEPNESQEPFVGGASEVSESVSIEEASSTLVAQDSNEKLKITKSTTPVPSETKPNPMENVVKLMKVVADTISKNTKSSFKSKINYLEKLRDTIMSNIKERIDAAWPDDAPAAQAAQGLRRARQARGHVEFPSSEGALMTISFLTFAVFLIKLVLQVISTYNNKAMMFSPAVFAVSRAASALRRKTGPLFAYLKMEQLYCSCLVLCILLLLLTGQI